MATTEFGDKTGDRGDWRDKTGNSGKGWANDTHPKIFAMMAQYHKLYLCLQMHNILAATAPQNMLMLDQQGRSTVCLCHTLGRCGAFGVCPYKHVPGRDLAPDYATALINVLKQGIKKLCSGNHQQNKYQRSNYGTRN